MDTLPVQGIDTAVLKRMRERAGVTQSSAAEEAGISQGMLSRIESGGGALTRDAAVKLGVVLKRSPDALLEANAVDRLTAVMKDVANLSDGQLRERVTTRDGRQAALKAAQLALKACAGAPSVEAHARAFAQRVLAACEASTGASAPPPTYKGSDGKTYYRDGFGQRIEVGAPAERNAVGVAAKQTDDDQARDAFGRRLRNN